MGNPVAAAFKKCNGPRSAGLLQRCLALVFMGIVFYSTYGFANWAAEQRPVVPEIFFSWERGIPFLSWSIIPYWSLNVFYAAGFFLCRKRSELCRYVAQLLTAQAIALVFFLLFPLQISWEKPLASGALAQLFSALAAFDKPYNQAPSLHVMLAMIIGRFYWLKLSGYWRLLWSAWMVLVVLSVLTTYQHHFIDIPCGVLAGIAVWWLFPVSGAFPLKRSLVLTAVHLRWVLFYAAAAAVCLAVMFQGGAWLWFGWPAAGFLLFCAAYSGLGAQALQKQQNGTFSGAAVLLLWPQRLSARLNMVFWLKAKPLYALIDANVAVGNILSAGHFDNIVDVCGEYPVSGNNKRYVSVPMLDMVPPEKTDLVQSVRALKIMCNEIQMTGESVLVCCALGYGRSVAVIATWLVYSGRCRSVDEAARLILKKRGRVFLPEPVKLRIEAALAELTVADMEKNT